MEGHKFFLCLFLNGVHTIYWKYSSFSFFFFGEIYDPKVYDQARFNRKYVECLNTELRCQLRHSSRSFKISYIHKKYFSSGFRIFSLDIYISIKAVDFWFKWQLFNWSWDFDIKREKFWIYEIINEESTVPFIELLKRSVKSTYTTHFSKTLKPVKGMQ